MSIRGRLDRLERALPDEDLCRSCGDPHVRDWAQIVVAAHEDRSLCACSACECHRFLDELLEGYHAE